MCELKVGALSCSEIFAKVVVNFHGLTTNKLRYNIV